MKVIVGSYRADRFMLNRALTSIDVSLIGVTGVVVVDDSGSPEFRQTTREDARVTRVVEVAPRQVGYNAAMKAVCLEAGETEFMFFEEDFVLMEKISLNEMSKTLRLRPYLAQLALLRGPHFRNERIAGGLLEALEERIPGSVKGDVEGIIEQTGTFTCNPAVWRAGVAADGWPDGEYSEDRKRDELLERGYSFGFVPGVMVQHDGIRSGFDY